MQEFKISLTSKITGLGLRGTGPEPQTYKFAQSL
jgi:hypothetical protein